MRGRRNTHRKTLSTSSCSSADSGATTPARNSLSEKDVEKLLDDESSADEMSKPRWPVHMSRFQCSPRSFIFYRRASALCIAFFIAFGVLSSAVRPIDPQQRSISIETPHIPAGLVFTDQAGRPRWTVSIPANSSFPLIPSAYSNICQDASRLTTAPTSTFSRLWRPTATGVIHDHTYMDISEAQSAGILPQEPSVVGTCDTSMTLIIDSNEASFGKTLMLIWLAYGLARRQGKAFFLDDSQWAYGRYDSYFPPLPRPACSRPSASQIVPCPLQARHVIITAATAKTAFQQAFRPRDHASIFDFARAGYEASFKLIGDDAAYAQDRLKTLRAQQQQLIGMHIRRGDLHPFELEYSQDYLPVDKFTDAAKRILKTDTPTTLLLSSDDPDIVQSTELTMAAAPHTLARSQERIQLATKLALDRTSPAKPIREPGSAYIKHIDENAGWDGGFYTALFHGIGDQRKRSEQHLLAAAPSKETLRMKELIGRGYLLDLTVLSQADGVVCAVSSAACRLLGVMMGQEAIHNKRWINVDDGRSWSWDGSR